MTEHDRQAEELEAELEDMEAQSERLGGEIDETRKDWERRQRDSSVPGATGEPEPESDDNPPPEQQYPAKGD